MRIVNIDGLEGPDWFYNQNQNFSSKWLLEPRLKGK